MSVYVEILLRAPLDAIWSHTQTPGLHERWDLRFSRIDYLPKAAHDAPQRFRYTTRIGFGVEVSGQGETVGQCGRADGSAASALKFGSEQRLSIIREGSGYWKYVPTSEGVRFLTWYDYRTRFGAGGAFFDRLLFRPLIGWATAWSFDRLRLWLEERMEPQHAARNAVVHFVARTTLAAIFANKGLVPQLTGLGIVDVIFALALLSSWCRAWPVWICAIEAACNPSSLSPAVAALAAIDLVVLPGVPSASRCLRRPPSEKP